MSNRKNSADKFITGEEFDIWLKSRQISLNDAAEWFGVSKPTIIHYRRAGLNKAQALAIAAIERGIPPWQPTEEDRQRAERKASE
jgi:predicted XRE-type DNA-binding protein